MQDDLPRARVSASAVVQTAVSYVDGRDAGTLLYRGYPFTELVERIRYEDVAWLLWTGELPTPAERVDLLHAIAAGAGRSLAVAPHLTGLPAGSPLAHLQAALALLALEAPELNVGAARASPQEAARLVGACAALAGSTLSGFGGADSGVIATQFADGVAAGFLALARGAPAPVDAVRAFDQVLIVLAEHELNASTYAARVAASTRASLISCVMAALSTLSGPLHAGVERLVQALLEAARIDGAERVVERYERAGHALPGFGHAVYRGGDPRAAIMRRLAETLAAARSDAREFALTRAIEEIAEWRRLPRANVDLYTTAVYRALDIPDALATLVFATARVAGWCAHICEQYAHNRLIRPRAEYIGPPERRIATQTGSDGRGGTSGQMGSKDGTQVS